VEAVQGGKSDSLQPGAVVVERQPLTEPPRGSYGNRVCAPAWGMLDTSALCPTPPNWRAARVAAASPAVRHTLLAGRLPCASAVAGSCPSNGAKASPLGGGVGEARSL
jgi:hypothetical protein